LSFLVLELLLGALITYLIDKAHQLTEGDFQSFAYSLEDIDCRVLLAFDDGSDVPILEVCSDGERGLGHLPLSSEIIFIPEGGAGDNGIPNKNL